MKGMGGGGWMPPRPRQVCSSLLVEPEATTTIHCTGHCTVLSLKVTFPLCNGFPIAMFTPYYIQENYPCWALNKRPVQ